MTAAGISYADKGSGTWNAFPSGDISGTPVMQDGYFAPNFRFTRPPANGVPEAGRTMALMLGAIGMLIAFRLLKVCFRKYFSEMKNEKSVA